MQKQLENKVLDKLYLFKIKRQENRRLLNAALNGSQDDRFYYCVFRAGRKSEKDFAAYGQSVYTTEYARRAIHWFKRLERISNRFINNSVSC